MGKVSPFYGTHSDRTFMGALRSDVSTSLCLGKTMVGVSLSPVADRKMHRRILAVEANLFGHPSQNPLCQ